MRRRRAISYIELMAMLDKVNMFIKSLICQCDAGGTRPNIPGFTLLASDTKIPHS